MASKRYIEPMLTVREASQLLNIHRNTLRRWSDQGIIRAYRIARRGDRKFRRGDIDHFLAEMNGTKDNQEITGSTKG